MPTSRRDLGKRGLRKLFELGQRFGVDILPRHFYSSVPDIRELRSGDGWKRPTSMVGVLGCSLPEQTSFLQSLYSDEVRTVLSRRDVYAEACRRNGAIGYGPIEAELLYAFVSTHRPTRCVQIGAGVSTAVILMAAEDLRHAMEIVCVDPYPTEFLRTAAQQGRIKLIDEPAQSCELDTFTGCGSGDLLFIDSTHTVKPGSEVNKIILEVLPRLSPGVFVHFHDICFPYDYSRDLLDSALFFWNESVLLQAYLSGNRGITVRLSSSMLHYAAPEELCSLFPRYHPQASHFGLQASRGAGSGDFPSATYLQVLDGRV